MVSSYPPPKILAIRNHRTERFPVFGAGAGFFFGAGATVPAQIRMVLPASASSSRRSRRRLSRLSEQILGTPAVSAVSASATASTELPPEVEYFCRDVDMSEALKALEILREFQGEDYSRPPPGQSDDAATLSAAASGMAEMMANSNDPTGAGNTSKFVGLTVDASKGLTNFSDEEVRFLKSALFSRGALVFKGIPTPWSTEENEHMDDESARSLAAFLGRFGEIRGDYFNPGYEYWHPAVPKGTLQKFSNDGSGVLLTAGSPKKMAAGEYSWHFDGEYLPWWTSLTSLFCERSAFTGHTTGYTSQRAAYLVALAKLPELVHRLRGMRVLCDVEYILFPIPRARQVELSKTKGVMSPEDWPAQWKPMVRNHYEAGYECFSGILAPLVDHARDPKMHHLINMAQENPEVRENAKGEANLGNSAAADGRGGWRRVMGATLVGDLQDALNRFVTQEAFRYFHAWERGDLVLWDNLATLHCVMPWKYGTKKDPEKEVRVMWRTCFGADDTWSLGNGQVDRQRMPPFL